jgi:hypothetical protein
MKSSLSWYACVRAVASTCNERYESKREIERQTLSEGEEVGFVRKTERQTNKHEMSRNVRISAFV